MQKLHSLSGLVQKANLTHLRVVSDLLNDLPSAIIQTRRDAGITQRELGNALGFKTSTVQRDEQNCYKGSSLHKLRHIVTITISLVEEKQKNLPSNSRF